LYNASVAYSGIKNLTLTGGIRNLFNTDPPFATNYDSIGGTGSSWEPRATDPRGRSFTLNIQYKFL
jgi:iron complex outermembrane receptor protein